MINRDDSGVLDWKDIKNRFGGTNVSKNVWKSLISEYDMNLDGKVFYIIKLDVLERVCLNDEKSY